MVIYGLLFIARETNIKRLLFRYKISRPFSPRHISICRKKLHAMRKSLKRYTPLFENNHISVVHTGDTKYPNTPANASEIFGI